MSPLVVEHFYYIVQDDKIVGRYGTSLNDALGHLRLYGKSKNGPNRAIIQVLRNRAQLAGTGLAPPRSSRISNEEESLLLEVKEYCYWEDDQVLENMMKIVETEHEIIMPSNHQKFFCSSSTPILTHPALTLSSQGTSRETVRKECYAYFVRHHREEYEQRNTSHLVLEEEEECISAMDATTRKKRKSCDHTTSSNHAATIAAGSARMKASRPSRTAAPTSTHTAH
eukprot:scaffold188_cov204-Chaetoceros_neogracile.AAC.2